MPRVPYGVISNRHGKGALVGRAAPRRGERQRLHPRRGARRGARGRPAGDRGRRARVVEFPLAPFLGTMGVAVAGGERPHSVPPGRARRQHRHQPAHRGHRALPAGAGATGALAYVGDPHFAQGDGEVALTALEASLRATLRFDVVPRAEALAEFGEVPARSCARGYLVPTGLDPDLNVAMRNCVRAALALIEARWGLDEHLAYAYLSAATDFDISQVVDIVCGVHARIREADFDGGRCVLTPTPRAGDRVTRRRRRLPPDLLTAFERLRARDPRERPRRARRDLRAGPRHDPRRRRRSARRTRRDQCVPRRPGRRAGADDRAHRVPSAGRRMPRSSSRSRATPAAAPACRRSCGSASTDAWLITAAHVTPRAQALDRSVWRTVGDPLWQGAWEGPLAGLTVAVKDLFAIKGYRIGAGNPTFLAEAARPRRRRPRPSATCCAAARRCAASRAPTSSRTASPATTCTTARRPTARCRARSPAARRAVPRPPSPPARPRSASRPTPPGRCACPRRTRACGVCARPTGSCRARGCCRSRSPSTPSAGSPATATTLQRVVDWCLSYDGSESTESVLGESGCRPAVAPLRARRDRSTRSSPRRAPPSSADRPARAASDDPPTFARVPIGGLDDYLRAVPHGAGRRGVAQQRRVGGRAPGCCRSGRRRALPHRRRR